MSAARILLFCLFVTSLLLTYYQWQEAPQRMATHFDAEGRPNSFASKDLFYFLQAAISALMLAIGSCISPLVKILPVKFVNLPNRDYWLTPERKESAMRNLDDYMATFGSAALLLLMSVSDAVTKANRDPVSLLDSGRMWIYLMSYFAFVILWLLQFYRAFRKPDTR